jgi:hypothetical protein
VCDWSGIERHLTATRDAFVTAPAKQKLLDELLNYRLSHTHHLSYAQRLSTGRSIGKQPDRRSVQKLDRPAFETDRRPMESPPSQPHGRPLLRHVQRRLEPIVEPARHLPPEFSERTLTA